jgi:hypothetical protein
MNSEVKKITDKIQFILDDSKRIDVKIKKLKAKQKEYDAQYTKLYRERSRLEFGD